MKGVVITLSCIAVLVVWSTMGRSAEGLAGVMVTAHNKVRTGLNLPLLVWSEDLAGYAQEWAVYLSEQNNCRLRHRPQKGDEVHQYGENLYWASPIRSSNGTSTFQEITASGVVASWVKEAADYNYTANSCSRNRVCGHYTQVVWRTTKRVGCARAVCADKGQVWVCNYDPPGNFSGLQPY